MTQQDPNTTGEAAGKLDHNPAGEPIVNPTFVVILQGDTAGVQMIPDADQWSKAQLQAVRETVNQITVQVEQRNGQSDVQEQPSGLVLPPQGIVTP